MMKNIPKPPFFTFPVLSEINKKGLVKNKNVKCPNCNRIHEVYEIGKSNIIVNGSYRDLDDIKLSLPDKLLPVLENYDCDFTTYEECELALKKSHKNGSKIILTKEIGDDEVTGKCVIIKKNGKFSIESYTYRYCPEVVINE